MRCSFSARARRTQSVLSYDGTDSALGNVIPAKAGIQTWRPLRPLPLDSRFRGNDNAGDSVKSRHALVVVVFEETETDARSTLDAVVLATRRELRRLFPMARVDADAVRTVIQNEVLKREVVDGDEAGLVQGDVKRAAARAARRKSKIRYR
jgi:hypothetical protein